MLSRTWGLRVLILPLVLGLSPARAAPADDAQFAVELEVGLVAGFLSGGITSLSNTLDEDALGDAIGSIGTGSGLLTRLAGRITLFGHDLLFNGVSDRILNTQTDAAFGGFLGGGYAEDALLMLAGELRPDLGDLFGELLGVTARSFVRLEIGRFDGAIEGAAQFSTRNGRPWFAGKTGRWSSRFFSVDAGLLAEETARASRGRTETYSFGYFVRYTTFSRPAVLGFGTDGDGYAVQDADLGMLALGARGGLRRCDGLCWSIEGRFIPFTGWTWLDLGPYGTVRGVTLAGGFEFRLSRPFKPGGVTIEPFATFHADWLFPLLGTYLDASIDRAQLWAPDYLLWGPGVGLLVSL